MHIVKLELEPSIRLRVVLVTDLVTGTRSELLTGAGLSADAEPQCHHTDTLGPAHVLGNAIFSLMHLSKPQGQVSDASL